MGAVAGLLRIIDDAARPHAERLAAGRELGQLGDPRLDGAMVEIPEGTFLRGSEEGIGHPNECPQREIFVSAFEIEILPVTYAQYQRFLAAGGYRERAFWTDEGWEWKTRTGAERPRFWGDPAWAHVTGKNQPLVGICYHEVAAYTRWAGKRLPTEAEWEKASRGTDGRVFPWGNDWRPDHCSHRGGPERAAPPVGIFPAGTSPYGLYDTVGGVWEFCSDWFDPDYYALAPEEDPPGPKSGETRSARGGAWHALPMQDRCAQRNAWKEEAQYSNFGFRCAR